MNRACFCVVAWLLAVCVSCSPNASRPTSAEPQSSESLTSTSGESTSQTEEAAASVQLAPSDWAAFLGTDGRARSADVVPTKWSDSENVLWKQGLPGTGSSSPIIVGDRVILTCYVASDGGNGKAKRQVLCFNKNDGAQLWSQDFSIDYREDPSSGFLTEHGYASNTPVSDGHSVYVFLGKGGVHSISLDGEKGWSYDAGKSSSSREWGSASSLTLYKLSLIHI